VKVKDRRLHDSIRPESSCCSVTAVWSRPVFVGEPRKQTEALEGNQHCGRHFAGVIRERKKKNNCDPPSCPKNCKIHPCHCCFRHHGMQRECHSPSLICDYCLSHRLVEWSVACWAPTLPAVRLSMNDTCQRRGDLNFG
jgi:hypothetical protein